MCRTRLHRVARIGRAAIAVLLLIPASASAQDVTEPALKAAFIYNFTKFTEWPADAAPGEEPLVLCVLGDTAVADALARAVKGRVVAGHGMSVSSMAAGGPARACHVLYISGVTARQATQLLAGVRDVPVLTIGDLADFTRLGGIARFFFEDGRLRFSVGLESARRAHLQISSRLLSLAKRE